MKMLTCLHNKDFEHFPLKSPITSLKLIKSIKLANLVKRALVR